MLLKQSFLFSALLFSVSILACGNVFAGDEKSSDYEAARWHPSHFKPTIDETSNEQCLTCHSEILDRKILARSPAGIDASNTQAWYQTLTTYEGGQETFHRRHLVTPLAEKLMDMKCGTCHQGNDPREETASSSATGNSALTQRKHVNPNICLMCHGAHPQEIMGLPGPWPETRDDFQNNCLICHAGIRTNRHKVNFLKADAIEKAGTEDGDVCYGCHGGRQWYRIAYPYARNAWNGMAKDIPEWAKDRPTQSDKRFRIKQTQAAK